MLPGREALKWAVLERKTARKGSNCKVVGKARQA